MPSIRSRRSLKRNAQGHVLKESRRYEGQKYLYWWDIPPSNLDRLDDGDSIEFRKKDKNEGCLVPFNELKPFLRKDRQTTRHEGNWGIRVLETKPDCLAFEPPNKDREWLFLAVKWVPSKR